MCDAPHIVSPHSHGNQNCQQFTCIFVAVDFIITNIGKIINFIVVNNLLVLFGCPTLMMDAMLATICDDGQAICQNYKE